MEVIKDFLRDLIGIIFPGCLLIIFIVWFVISFLLLFIPINSTTLLSISQNFYFYIVLLIFSYIAGLSSRIKRLDDLEEKCTIKYRETEKKNLTEEDFNNSIEEIKKEEDKYYSGNIKIQKLKEIYRIHNEKFGLWEFFPYPYVIKGRRLIQQSKKYNKFFEKYEKKGITKFKTFFNFCKSVIYEYSTSLKEEVIRQESLVRLFAGIYYAIKYGMPINIFLGTAHLIKFIYFYSKEFTYTNYLKNCDSLIIFIICLFLFFILMYINNEIIQRLRIMRAKELNLTYDAFYIICQKNNLHFLFNNKKQLTSVCRGRKGSDSN